jgi:hypothetical protein
MRPYRRLNNATGVRSAQISQHNSAQLHQPDARRLSRPRTWRSKSLFEIACESDAPVGEIDG